MARDWNGKRVCITGKLASMSREEAVRRLESAGATFVQMPDERTSAIVVGDHGLPLETDGRPTAALRRARDLGDRGCSIEFLLERDLLERLDAADLAEDLRRLYTAEQLARLLDVQPTAIRAWVRRGLLRPARRMRRLSLFDFEQVGCARALHRLLEAGVPMSKIKDSIGQLARWLPDAGTRLRWLESGTGDREIAVRLSSGQLAEPSGQLLFEFGRGGEDRAGELRQHPRAAPRLDWFDAGLRAEEEGRFADAVAAYRRELMRSGPAPEVHFNLGNALYRLGRLREAAAAYRAAVGLDPEYTEAWNNLGNVLVDEGRLEDALTAYRRALAMDPLYADAHYNLAETLCALDRRKEAEPHWRRYLQLDPRSPWAERARRRIQE